MEHFLSIKTLKSIQNPKVLVSLITISSLKLIYFSDFLGFKQAYLCLYKKKKNCTGFKGIHPSEQKLQTFCHGYDLFLVTR